jgi:hypothetical protein
VKLVEIVLRKGEEIRKNDRREVNLIKTYGKHLCTCHNVSFLCSYYMLMKRKKERKRKEEKRREGRKEEMKEGWKKRRKKHRKKERKKEECALRPGWRSFSLILFHCRFVILPFLMRAHIPHTQ